MKWSMQWSKDPKIAVQQVKDHFIRFDIAVGRVLPIPLMKIRDKDKVQEYDEMLFIYPELEEFRLRAFFTGFTQKVAPEPTTLITRGNSRMPFMSTADFKYINDRVFMRAYYKKC